jgi:hypothetical protein
MAGSSRHRTTTASTTIPAPSPVARIFRSVIDEVDRDTKLSIRIAAAPVTSRPVRPRPSTIAERADPEESYAPRTRVAVGQQLLSGQPGVPSGGQRRVERALDGRDTSGPPKPLLGAGV